MLSVISTDNAPKALGPYSQAVTANGFVFVSGQIAVNPKTGQLLSGSIAAQTKQVLENISFILQGAGSDLKYVVKTTVFLKNLQNFEEMNKTYSEFFPSHKPARATVEVSGLPKDAAVEIEVTAILPP